MPLEKNRAKAIDNMHKKSLKIGCMAHRQTNMQANTQTDMLIAILCHPYWGESEKTFSLP